MQLDDAMDFMEAPRPDDYGFGTFVKLEDPKPGRHWAVGLVYNSQILNPAFNSLGPRLSSEPDPLFTPDLIAETRTLLWTVLIGNLETIKGKHHGIQGIPRVVVPVNTEVQTMNEAEIHNFHQDFKGRSQFTYYSHLLRSGGTFASQLTHQVLDELIGAAYFQGDEQRALTVLAKELAWKNTMGVM
ncbi:hypothetical protein [Romeriopsis navalis]|uniref:hypothetical protein n=1 Tax=Romeriopsis navalis TaxID=2992132 RepID=UPI0029CA150C|nr:hypothetical protein [Romeriopsis navalis]